jgi:hypothetical protein
MNQAEVIMRNFGRLREEAKSDLDSIPNLRDDLVVFSVRVNEILASYLGGYPSTLPQFEPFKSARENAPVTPHVISLMNGIVENVKLFACSVIPTVFQDAETGRAVLCVFNFAVKRMAKAVAQCDQIPDAGDACTDLIFHYPDGCKSSSKSWDLALSWAILGYDEDYGLPATVAASMDSIAKLRIIDTIYSNNPACITTTDMFGFRPLHYAARRSSVEVWNRILSLDPKILLTVSQHNETPLHIVAAFSPSGDGKLPFPIPLIPYTWKQ